MPEKTYENYEQERPVMNMMNKNSHEYNKQVGPVSIRAVCTVIFMLVCWLSHREYNLHYSCYIYVRNIAWLHNIILFDLPSQHLSHCVKIMLYLVM
jgi:hypothetical protein